MKKTISATLTDTSIIMKKRNKMEITSAAKKHKEPLVICPRILRGIVNFITNLF